MIYVECRCRVRRAIDPSQVGAWRLRCKQCGDVLYDPSTSGRHMPPPPPTPAATPVAPMPGTPVPSAMPSAAPLLAADDDGLEDTSFQQWLRGSGELKVLVSSDGAHTAHCSRHPAQRVVAACTRCSELLCKHCLDRIDDEFVCSECVAKVASEVDPTQGGLLGWFKRLLGGG